MENYKKILIVITIFIFIYIIYRFLKEKKHIQELFTKEGLENPTLSNEELEFNSLKSEEPVIIQSIYQTDVMLPLKEFVMKASYNSAFTGEYMNLDMIKYVLSRGCRFLDFEVFKIDNKPQVAYSTDSTFKSINSKNSLLFDDVLTTTITNAFSDTSPNRLDPIFIHLRVKSTTNDIYKLVAKSLYVIKDSIYNKSINIGTRIQDIMGKVIIIMDSSVNYDYKNYTTCSKTESNCYDLIKLINIESGKEQISIQRYSDILNEQIISPRIINDNYTDAQFIKLALPDYDVKQIENPSIIPLVNDHGVQIITYRYYKKDSNLNEYENVFNENKAGMVPMATILKYLDKKKQEAEST
uniref:Phosphatidylinositol-specific phospholipase C X domain-containing protein n=1 Tax=viral metagenome TaxID=1070528 RepID=A0A6C0LRN9_9ZZZZ